MRGGGLAGAQPLVPGFAAAGRNPSTRYIAGRWPEGNIDAQITGDEPCNGYDALTEIGVA